VNLIAGRQIVPELIQYDMTPARVAAEAENLLAGTKQADRMREDLAHVRAALTSEGDPLRRTADLIGGKLAESKAPSHTLIYSGRQ